MSFSEVSKKEPKKIKLSSNKKKPMPYKLDYYHYTGDSRDSKKYDYTQDTGEKHKRSKSQTINSLKSRKGNSAQEASVEEMTYLLQKHLAKNSKTSYHLVNEYLENPKGSQISVSSAQNLENSHSKGNRSRKRANNNVQNSGIIHHSKSKRTNTNLLKKIAFKSFDKRRAGTGLERRDGSLDDPLGFLRSSSACNQSSQEKSGINSTKKSNRTSKGVKNKKLQNAVNYSKVSSNNAV